MRIKFLFALIAAIFIICVTLIADDSARTRVTERTLFITEQLAKYSSSDNNLNYWLDRPLLYDRSLRAKKIQDKLNPVLFQEKARQAKAYGADAFIGFGGETSYLNKYFDAYKESEFPVVISFAPPSAGSQHSSELKTSIEQKAASIKVMLNAKNPLKINGKLLLVSYNAASASPEDWKHLISELKKQCGDTFMIVSDIDKAGGKSWYAWVKDYYDNGCSLSDTAQEKIKTTFRQYLDVTDGIMFMCTNDLRKQDCSFADDFHKNILLKLMTDVLNEPAYKGKLLGAGTSVGYINWFIGSTQYENETKTFRKSFENSMSVNPDFIAGFEWDEANEGDYIQPSIYNSFALQRICRYYTDILKGKEASPMSGDNTVIPNLVLSFRKIVTLGERIDMELLNVPDKKTNSSYKVEFSLKNSKNETLKTFPAINFDSGRLYDETVSVPSEIFSSELFLRPSLTIWNSENKKIVFEDGLPDIQLNATWNFNRKCVKMPLRDIIADAKCSLSAKLKDKTTSVDVKFSCAEEIASAELIQNEEEAFAFNPEKKNETVCLFVEFSSSRIKELKGKLSITGSDFTLEPADKWDGKISQTGNTVLLKHPWILIPRKFYLKLPATTAPKAVLSVEFNGHKEEIPVKNILDTNAFAWVYNDFQWCSVEVLKKLDDVPEFINQKSIAFSCNIFTEEKNSVLYLRVITKSGKMYRSAPVIVNKSTEGNVPLNVYSQTEKKVLTVQVEKSLIPMIDYAFNQKSGAILTTPSSSRWYGEIGGGNGYGKFFRNNNYPAESKETAPKWTITDNAQCLEFDGKGNYIFFPKETLPQGAFTLEMNLKPSEKAINPLIKSREIASPEFFDLIIKNGTLQAIYYGEQRIGDKDLWFNKIFMDTGLKVDTDKWNKIIVSYDLKNFIFSVNGKKSKTFQFSRGAYTFRPFAFGGNTSKQENYFKGYLKSLKITHNADNQ